MGKNKMKNKLPEIKFSHRYKKMPLGVDTFCESIVLDIEVTHFDGLTLDFIKYDTEYDGGFYELPKTKLLVIQILTEGIRWTTVRRWTPKKEKWYKSLIGKEVKIIILKDK